MKLPQVKHIRWNYLALAFALPLVGMLLYLLILQFVGLFGPYRIPFGKTTMLYSDMYHQYYPFFTAFRRALLSGDSLLYSWDVGMGMDYLGLFSYYLASPLNLLCILLPESWTLGFFSLLVPVKLGFAGLFFAVFLKKLFGKNDLSITLFGSFYAMCGWALAYQWNVMWLDSFALLPLVALGTISLLRDKKFILYTVTLFLSIYANYYIGLFVCIFVLLLFVCYEICRFRGFLPLLKDLCRIALFSALAIGMTAFLELPAFQALQVTQSGNTGSASGLQGLLTSLQKIGTKMNIAKERSWKGLFDAMRQVAGNMGGGLSPSFKEGLPNLYSGVGTIVLAFLFLSAREIKLRDKICSVLLLVFFILSTILRQLDYIWHGFHFTNMIPYRFTFLYSFVLLYMAYRAYLLRSRFSKTRIIIAGVLALGVLACSDKRFDFVFLCYNLLFLGLYLFVFLYGTVKRIPPEDASEYTQARYAAANSRRRHRTAMLLACVLVLELVLNMVNFAANFTFTSAADYPKGTAHLQSMVRYMKEREARTPFYRAEVTHAQTLNDGALIGYRGISAFTSSANVKVTRFMDALGYGAKNTYNRYCFEESSPVANLFLGLKYMLERGTYKENAYFDKIHTYGSIVLLENNAYLPLGFLANTQLANVDFSASGDHLKFQNTLLKAASGVTEDVWYRLPAYTLSISGVNASVSNESSGGYCSYTADESGSSKVIYTYTPDVSGLLCVDLDLPKRNSLRIYVDDKELYYETYSLPQMLSICDVTPESKVEIHIYCGSKENSTLNVKAAVLQEPLFRQAYDVLAASQLELTTFQNTLIEGTIQCDRDGLLYTSVPQDGNWVVLVDGTEVEPVLVGGAMIGIPLLEGSHTVVLRYQNQAFSLGWKISLGCLLVFLVLIILYRRPRIKRGRYERR